MTLAEYLRKRDLTIEEFGALIGKSRSTTHRIVRRLALPMPKTAQRIVKVTKGAVTLKDLYA